MSHRQLAAPPPLARGVAGGPRQVEVRHRHPHGIAEQAHASADVAPVKGRRRLRGMQGVDDEQLADAVRIGDADVRHRRVRAGPSVGLGVALRGAPDLVLPPGDAHPDRAVPSRAMQGVVRVPRDRHAKGRVADMCGVDDHEIAEATLGTVPPARARVGEHPLEVPRPVLVLAQDHDRPQQIQTPQVQSPVDQVARIVVHAYGAGGDEQRVLVVANLE
jgi:hypothetical protein